MPGLAKMVSYLTCSTHGVQSVRVSPGPDYCPACVTAALAAGAIARRVLPGTSSTYQVFSPALALYPLRTVKLGERARSGAGHRCDARCTGGKRSCDCVCAGRCHGAGVCSC